MNIVLFGFKNAGKTYFGTLLAKKLNLHFIDTDRLIEDEYVKESGYRLSCRQIHLEIGNGLFRLLERKVISRLTLVKDSVIALGGGAILDQQTFKGLKPLGVLVYLRASKEVISNRFFDHQLPSFIDPLNPKESFDNMYNERNPMYENRACYALDLENKTDDQVLEELVSIWETSKKSYGIQ